MVFWCVLIFITVVVVVLLVSVLSRNIVLSVSQYKNDQSELDFYKSQLLEIDEEEGSGQISVESASEARLELARRILANEKQARHKSTHKNHLMRSVVFIGILSIVIGSWGIYYFIGNPNLLSQPFEALMMRDDVTLDLSERVVKTEVLLARNPDNSRLLDNLGDLYLQIGRFSDAANIFSRSLRLNGESSTRFLGYGMALMGNENGVVNKDAESAFQKANQLDQKNSEPLIFLARGLIQNGKVQEAIELLENFVRNHGKGQPWVTDMHHVVDQLKANKTPNQNKLIAEQHDLIANNVSRIEKHLHDKPQDLQGWLMLINAYLFLDRPEKMRNTYNNALKVLSAENKENFIMSLKEKGVSLLPSKEAP